jgi:hypothetical protein
MASVLLGGLVNLLGGGGAASAAAGGAGAAAAATTSIAGVPVAAASGLSLTSLLQGTATVLGIASSVAGGNAEAAQAELAASDAEAEQPLENLQGIARRSSIKRQMADAIGAENVAYAASGVDLSTGTAAAARSDAYRDADLALTTDAGTQETRLSRLSERAKNYRLMAKQSRRSGWLTGLTGGLNTLLSFGERGGY